MNPPTGGADDPCILSVQDFGHVREPVLRQLVEYWLAKRGERLMPSLADIDPVEIPWALSLIWILDYLPDVARFRYRLAGEEINAVTGQNLRGLYLDETLPVNRCQRILGKFEAIVENRSVVHDSGCVYLRDDRLATGERIVFPLSNDGETVAAVLGGTVYAWGSASEAADAGAMRQTTTSTRIETRESESAHSDIS